MARRYRSRYTRKSHTLILILVSAIALLAAWGLWMAWSAIREYQASRDAYDEIILETADRYGVDPALVKAVIWRESRFRPLVGRNSGVAGYLFFILELLYTLRW